MIVQDPEILSGIPVISGTRVPAYDIVASIRKAIPRERIMLAYPSITDQDIDDALAFEAAHPVAPPA